MKYYIYDWAGNELWRHGSFSSFEDGWDYIMEHWENEEDHQDLYVLEKIWVSNERRYRGIF